MTSQNAATFYHPATDLFVIVCGVVVGVLAVLWLIALLADRSRPMLNCLIVAVALWVDGGCRQYLWTRRSRTCRGLIPHFGTAQQRPGRNVRVVEYIPPRRDALDGGILFQGEYRVWHLRVTDVRRFTDRAEALAHNPAA
jgi:hypothetical protein